MSHLPQCGTATATTAAPEREQKYLNLLQIERNIDEVTQHINDIFNEIGCVSSQPSEAMEKYGDMSNLVTTIDFLPSVISKKCSDIHSTLEELKRNLV